MIRPPLWLEVLHGTAWLAGLLLMGAGVHYALYVLDDRWPAARPQRPARSAGVVLRVRRARPGRWRITCLLTRRHPNAVRHPLGGFKCPDCGVTGADFEEMGFPSGYVEKRTQW